MTVQQLIQKLQRLDPKASVVMSSEGNEFHFLRLLSTGGWTFRDKNNCVVLFPNHETASE